MHTDHLKFSFSLPILPSLLLSEEEVGKRQQGIDRPGVRLVQEGGGEQGKMEETGCEVICGAPTSLAVKR